MSSHTYSHPLDWRFFERYDRALEGQYAGSGQKLRSRSDAAVGRSAGYGLPRSYADHPFDLEQEIAGSIAALGPLLPPGKRVELVQWSGDTLPFREAVLAVRRTGLRAINGGDTRFDRDFPSYAWVAPVGRPVGQHWQVYLSNSNENTYTDLWTDRFFGFTFLMRTIRNTEVPLRVKPFNVYYHMYSGEKLAALNAVRRNLEYARTQPLAPVAASRYAAIADGFYSARVEQLGPRRWRVTNRGALGTLRFDRASRLAVDLDRSTGVTGARHQQGSLYVSLDEDAVAPEVVLRDLRPDEQMPRAARPFLVHARWRVWRVRDSDLGLQFRAQGFGPGEFLWQMPRRTRVRVAVQGREAPPIDAVAGRTVCCRSRSRRLRSSRSRSPSLPGEAHREVARDERGDPGRRLRRGGQRAADPEGPGTRLPSLQGPALRQRPSEPGAAARRGRPVGAGRSAARRVVSAVRRRGLGHPAARAICRRASRRSRRAPHARSYYQFGQRPYDYLRNLEQIAARAPTEAVLRQLADIYSWMDEPEKQIETLGLLDARGRAAPGDLEALARLRAARGRYDEAVAALERAEALSRSALDDDGLELLASLLVDAGHAEQALTRLAGRPEVVSDVELAARIAGTFHGKGHPELAARLLEASPSLDQRNPGALAI